MSQNGKGDKPRITKYKNYWAGYDEINWSNKSLDNSTQNDMVKTDYTECPNCKEKSPECGCIRNKCARCNGPVGNITFTICDKCWDLEEKM